MNVPTTVHAEERMRERGITEDLTDLVIEWGEPLEQNPDRLLLTRKVLRRLWKEGRLEREVYLQADRAVPLVCVVREGRLLTAFRPIRRINRSFRRRRRRHGYRTRRNITVGAIR